ncbi:hypothetical protein V502_06441 [Pseudogymnoascus sp. VKM F-4520 (FW-2644)]|nr:hypothetical protein V502_06441 [Pseudogymnoascus sp. VKM F-4520 (FW-2644)]
MESGLASQFVPQEPQPTFMTKAFITALADVRILVGAAAIILPLPAASLFGLPIASTSRGIGQFYGARELAVGGLLFASYNSYMKLTKQDGVPLKATREATNATIVERKEALKNVLWTCLLVDTIDLGCIAVNAFRGEAGMRALWIGGGAGVAGAVFAASALRAL